MFRSLRSKLVASFCAVIFLCLLLAGTAFVYMLRDYQRQIKLNQLADLAAPTNLQVRLLERAGASPDQLASFLRERAAENQIRILLVDPSGTVVSDTSGALDGRRVHGVEGWEIRRPGPPEIPAVTVVRSSDGLILVAAPTRSNSPSTDRFVSRAPSYSVVLAVPEQSLTASWLELAPSLSFAALVSLVVSVAVAFLLSRSISRPVVAITRASEEIAKGRYEQHIPVKGHDEISRLAEAFNHMARQVDVSHRTLRDFLANVSHDLRTPLTSIQGFSQAMVDGTAKSPGDYVESARIINEEAERMRRLVEDLLLLSKIESGQLPMSKEILDLRELLRICVKRVSNQALHSQVALSLDANETAPILGDEGRLEQLFLNLLDNALKHTTPGGAVTVSLAAVPAAPPPVGKRMPAPAQPHYEVRVHNTGSYVPPEDQERIFERFYQVDKSRTRNGDGTGLGLAIAKEIANAHGAEISVRSDPETGTEFAVRFKGGSGGQAKDLTAR